MNLRREGGQDLRRIVLGIHRDKQRLYVRAVGAQDLQSLRHGRQGDRADALAGRVTEEHEQMRTVEIPVADRLSGVIDQLEGPADAKRESGGRCRGRLRLARGLARLVGSRVVSRGGAGRER